DPYGNTATGYTGTVHFRSADPYGARLPADYTFQASDQGVHTFAGGGTLYTARTGDVTATGPGLPGAAPLTLQAAPGAALPAPCPRGGAGGGFPARDPGQRTRGRALRRAGPRRGRLRQHRPPLRGHVPLPPLRRRPRRGAAAGLHLPARRRRHGDLPRRRHAA